VVEAGWLQPQPAGERPHRAAVIAARAKERGRRAQDARGGGPFRSGGDEGGAHTYLTFVRHAIHGGPAVKAARGGRRDPLRCGAIERRGGRTILAGGGGEGGPPRGVDVPRGGGGRRGWAGP